MLWRTGGGEDGFPNAPQLLGEGVGTIEERWGWLDQLTLTAVDFQSQNRHFQTRFSVMARYGGLGVGRTARAGIPMGPNRSRDVWEQLGPIENEPSEYHDQL